MLIKHYLILSSLMMFSKEEFYLKEDPQNAVQLKESLSNGTTINSGNDLKGTLFSLTPLNHSSCSGTRSAWCVFISLLSKCLTKFPLCTRHCARQEGSREWLDPGVRKKSHKTSLLLYFPFNPQTNL